MQHSSSYYLLNLTTIVHNMLLLGPTGLLHTSLHDSTCILIQTSKQLQSVACGVTL